METMKSLNHVLMQFKGTDRFHGYLSGHITDGIKYAAVKYGLFWFLDVIFSYQENATKQEKEFQVWTLRRNRDNTLSITYDDGNGNTLKTQHIAFADFENDHFQVYLISNIILLPSEY
jgi:hypothetical protein